MSRVAPQHRALFVCPTLAVGGAERRLAVLVPALRERGFSPTVITLKHEGRFYDELCAQGVPVHFAAMGSRADLKGARRAFALARSARPDIVVTHSIDAHVIGHRMATNAGVSHVALEGGGPGLRPALHRRMLYRLVAPRADRVIAVTAAQVPALVSLGYPEHRVVVIPSGVPAPEPRRGRAEVRAELGVGDAEVLALLVATLRPEKRAPLFVDAVAAARGAGAPVRGVVAGAGPELELVREHAAAAGCVAVLGQRDDVSDLIAAADVVCLTSRTEGLPVVVLETMAVGRPVLATAVGGIPEAVTPETGVLVDGDATGLSDALVRLAGDPGAREAMGRAARARFLAAYTSERMADAYAAQLRELIAAHAHGAGSSDSIGS